MKKSLITQAVWPKASAAHRVIGLMQTFACRTCTSACQLFCLPFQALPCGDSSCCTAQSHQLEPEEKKQDPSQAVHSVPSTILIVNISNSTLIDCVIGDSCPSAERQPLMQEPELQKPGQVKCDCSQKNQASTQSLHPPSPPPLDCPSPPQEQLNISIESSRLNCVIIGDNNYMHTEMSRDLD